MAEAARAHLRESGLGARAGRGGQPGPGGRARRGRGGAGRRARGARLHQRRHRGRRAGPPRRGARAPAGATWWSARSSTRRSCAPPRRWSAAGATLDVVPPGARRGRPRRGGRRGRPPRHRGRRRHAGQQRARHRPADRRDRAGLARTPDRRRRPHLHVDARAGVRPPAAARRARWAPTRWRSPATSCTGRTAPARSGCARARAWRRSGTAAARSAGCARGTENLPAMRRVRAARPRWRGARCDARRRRGACAALRDRLEREVLARWPAASPSARPTVTGAPRAPHIASLAFPGLPAEPLLHALEARGVYASAGSACASRTRRPQPVLEGDRRRRPHRRAALFAVARHDRRPTSTARSPPSPTRPARSPAVQIVTGGSRLPSPRRPARRVERPPPMATQDGGVILCRYGELFLKSGNRRRFERMLCDNIRAAVADFAGRRASTAPTAGSWCTSAPDDVEDAAGRLERVFGLVSFSVARAGLRRRRAGGDRRRRGRGGRGGASRAIARSRFKVEARRGDKRFPMHVAGDLAAGRRARPRRRPGSASTCTRRR